MYRSDRPDRGHDNRADNRDDDRADDNRAKRWSTPAAAVLCAGVGAAGALAWCLLGPSDPAGRLLLGVAAAALGLAAGYATLARPRLAADLAGVRVGGPRGTLSYPWSAVRCVRVAHTRRFGREVPTLELETHHDGAERLHVFGRLDLGEDPRDVADTLDALRAAR